MKTKQHQTHRKRSAWIASVGLGLLAIVQCDAHIQRIIPSIPSALFSFLTGVAILLLVVAIGLWLFSFCCHRFNLQHDYVCEQIKRRDINDLYNFLRNTLGDDILPERTMRAFYDKNDSVFYGVYKCQKGENSEHRTLAGHFSVAPISGETKTHLLANTLKGSDFTADCISTRKQRPAAFYIGAVVGKGLKGRAETLEYLLEHLIKITNKKAPFVFTRPVTPDGLRLCLKHGFTPVIDTNSPPENTIYHRNYTDE